MPIKEWRRLLQSLENGSALGAHAALVAERALKQFEQDRGIKLPRGYCDFSRVFGPGRLGGHFSIAVPEYSGTPLTLNLEYLDREARDCVDQWFDDGGQSRASYLYFASDDVRAFYFFDTSKVTDATRSEYQIMRIDRNYTIHRTARTFWEFVTECCLGEGRRGLVRGVPVERSFVPYME